MQVYFTVKQQFGFFLKKRSVPQLIQQQSAGHTSLIRDPQSVMI